jgi:DNA-binding Lrp family transcriptional regulator
LDRLDVKILGELLGGDATSQGFRKPFRAIAEKLRVDENTVRNRLEKLKRSGFLKGWWVGVNPSLLGLKLARAWLEVHSQPDKANLVQQISLVSGVALVLDYYGPALSLLLFYDQEEALRTSLELISRIADSTKLDWVDVPFPASEIALTTRDWNIVLSLQKDPWKPFVEIAEELGVSTVTVKRRVARMNRSKAMYLLADIDPKAAEGNLLAHLIVFYDAPEWRPAVNQRISSQLGEEVAFAELDDANHGFFALMLTNISRVREILNWVGRQEGVKRARLDILHDMITFPHTHESLARRGLRASTHLPSRLKG